MALFNSYDIAELKAVQSDKRAEQFTKDYSEEIEMELKELENMIRMEKTFFFNALKNRTTHLKTAVVEVSTIMSFNFSKVGGPRGCYLTDDDEYTTYDAYASREFPTSFCMKDGYPVSKFNLWKSKDFLVKLAERLELPNNMYFQIRSNIVDTENKIFQYENKIVQYVTDLCLVVSFV